MSPRLEGTSPRPPADSPPPAGVRRYVVLGVATLAFAAAVGLTRFGYTLVLPGMRTGLGLSAGEMGLIAGLALASYLACSLPAGALATRYGTRRVVSGGLLLSATGLAATGLATNLPSAALAQMLAGGSAAGVIVPTLAVGAAWFGPSHWNRATGVVVGGGGIGLLATGLLVPLLLGDQPGINWRLAWFGLAACVFGLAVLAALTLGEPPGRRGGARQRPPLRLVYRNSSVWQLGLVFLAYGLAYVIYGTFFAAHLAQHAQLAPGEIGLLWSLAGLAGVVGSLGMGVLADRVGPRWSLVLLFAIQGSSEVMLGLGQSSGWFLASALLYGLVVWSFAAVISSACAQAVGPALAPAGVSLAVLLMSVGQMLGPIVGGLLADHFGSFTPALLLATAVDVCGLLGSAALRLRPRVMGEEL